MNFADKKKLSFYAWIDGNDWKGQTISKKIKTQT